MSNIDFEGGEVRTTGEGVELELDTELGVIEMSEAVAKNLYVALGFLFTEVDHLDERHDDDDNPFDDGGV